jgi:hypothetical protein
MALAAPERRIRSARGFRAAGLGCGARERSMRTREPVWSARDRSAGAPPARPILRARYPEKSPTQILRFAQNDNREGRAQAPSLSSFVAGDSQWATQDDNGRQLPHRVIRRLSEAPAQKYDWSVPLLRTSAVAQWKEPPK